MNLSQDWSTFLRSDINRIIEESIQIIERQGFALPPFAYWSPREWQEAGPEWDTLRLARLGWDVTDFGWGDFLHTGRVLFTLRNGISGTSGKPYAEKIIVGRQGQRAPMHSHIVKIEDIINRGGGDLVLEMSPASNRTRESRVYVDGKKFVIEKKTVFRLKPGQSLCIEPGVNHQFWGEITESGKIPLIGEVSSFCDDVSDNTFVKEVARFANIIEDEPARFCLCHELPAAQAVAKADVAA